MVGVILKNKKLFFYIMHDPSKGYDDDKIKVVCLVIISKIDIENRLKHQPSSRKFRFSPSKRVKF